MVVEQMTREEVKLLFSLLEKAKKDLSVIVYDNKDDLHLIDGLDLDENYNQIRLYIKIE